MYGYGVYKICKTENYGRRNYGNRNRHKRFAMAPLFTGRGELTISVRVMPSPFALCMIIMYIIPITVPMVTPTAAAAAA